jgi:hypothetical protein
MLARLRHHAFIRRDYERKQIDPVRSRQHVSDETFVTGNVNKTEPEAIQLQIGETEIDRDPASFFFRKPVRISACEGSDERAFPVIDMACRADYY